MGRVRYRVRDRFMGRSGMGLWTRPGIGLEVRIRY